MSAVWVVERTASRRFPYRVSIEQNERLILDPVRLGGRWPPAHLARVLAELAALRPALPVVYAGNRKLANLWTYRFFGAVAARTGAGRGARWDRCP